MHEQVPVSLIEDGETGDRFLIHGSASGVRIELRYEGDTLWMTQAQMAELFGVTRQSVNSHINNIYTDDELDREATCKETLQVRSEGGREVSRKALIHNLDIIIAVAYRVSSKQGTLFRRWATDKLVQFATKGFVIDAVRLKDPESSDRISELKELIRDIRSDEANVYRELRRICSMCQDYDPAASASREFYVQTQAKLIWAVTTKTPAEIVFLRANILSENMGLTNWKHDNIRKSDVSTAKSYLAPPELKELNRLTVILLDIFEDQLEIGRLTLMSDATALLNRQLRNLNRQVLDHGGRIRHDDAKLKSEKTYEAFKAKLKLKRDHQADEAIATIAAQVKALPKTKTRPA